MKTGTKSVLFGVHCWFLHPWFVLAAWWKLYGFPWDLRLWAAFFVHDLGYFGKPNMDGPEGMQHPEWGAGAMRQLFDNKDNHWYNFCKYHSRFLAKQDGQSYSRLCVADKLAIALTPSWFYLPFAHLSGEVHEYMRVAAQGREGGGIRTDSSRHWFSDVQKYVRRWVEVHKTGAVDTWTLNPNKG